MANACDEPNESSIDAFMGSLTGHNKIRAVNRRGNSYTIDLLMRNDHKQSVYVTNIYVVGEADVRQILTQHPNSSCIVTLSSWNMVSKDAAKYGSHREVGVFTWGEFFGAINYKKYWLYESIPTDLSTAQEAAEKRRRRAAWN